MRFVLWHYNTHFIFPASPDSQPRRHLCLILSNRTIFMNLTWYPPFCDLDITEIIFCRSYLRWLMKQLDTRTGQISWKRYCEMCGRAKEILTDWLFQNIKRCSSLNESKRDTLCTFPPYKMMFWRSCIFPVDSELCYITRESSIYCILNTESYRKVSEAVTLKTHYVTTLSAAWDSQNSRSSLCQSIFYLLKERSSQKRKFNSAKWNPSDIKHETSNMYKTN